MNLKAVGVVHSNYHFPEEAPRQGKYTNQISTLEIFSPYVEALAGIEKRTHILVLYWGDRANRETLKSTPPNQEKKFGVFSIRSPHRPNPIAICVCKIVSVEENKVQVQGLDALNNSPLLDIKPYIQEIDTDQEYYKNQ